MEFQPQIRDQISHILKPQSSPSQTQPKNTEEKGLKLCTLLGLKPRRLRKYLQLILTLNSSTIQGNLRWFPGHGGNKIIKEGSNVHPYVNLMHIPYVNQGEGWSQDPEHVKNDYMSYSYDALSTLLQAHNHVQSPRSDEGWEDSTAYWVRRRLWSYFGLIYCVTWSKPHNFSVPSFCYWVSSTEGYLPLRVLNTEFLC